MKQIILAQTQHIESIVALVNQAYRPEDAALSWTNEANWVDGDRTSFQQVQSLFKVDSFILLMFDQKILIACVHIEQHQDHAYIGMLSTHIDYQNQGVGKIMLAAAEQFIRENLSVQYIEMSVLSTRQELIAFYQRRGYQLDGQVQAYPTDAGVGIPRVDNLQVLTMCKNLVS
ncbi:GNAT family N-acetyltransferase [Acinetobacter populi]|uniref:N-acetyltransferase domain-containing protein n=1 Tax=Acinetobacter populi TaxID=1582270 RepID=A0A1Z9YVW3_9GAMM|nr:GNAT family N-acetyltransferase [Acinetobacter populi]OUY06350.1 hypothetical protein CAP51_13925 [Acinetobacter populi]